MRYDGVNEVWGWCEIWFFCNMIDVSKSVVCFEDSGDD